jgi:hypothetical protein
MLSIIDNGKRFFSDENPTVTYKDYFRELSPLTRFLLNLFIVVFLVPLFVTILIGLIVLLKSFLLGLQILLPSILLGYLVLHLIKIKKMYYTLYIFLFWYTIPLFYLPIFTMMLKLDGFELPWRWLYYFSNVWVLIVYTFLVGFIISFLFYKLSNTRKKLLSASIIFSTIIAFQFGRITGLYWGLTNEIIQCTECTDTGLLAPSSYYPLMISLFILFNLPFLYFIFIKMKTEYKMLVFYILPLLLFVLGALLFPFHF